MVQQVDVDGEIHEFPDEATPAMMQAALKTESARQQFTNLTQHGIVDRPRERLMSDAWSALKGIGNALAKGVPTTLNQAVSRPGQAAKNVGAGLAGIPFNIVNSIMNIPQYVAHLESEKASDVLKKYTPQIPVDKIQNKLFGEGNQSDTDVRNLASLAPILFPAGRVATSAVKGGVAKVIGKTDPALEANEALLGTKVGNKAVELEQKTIAAQAADEANKVAISKSRQEIGKSDADLMQFNVTKRQNDIQNMTDEASQLQKKLLETRPAETELPQAEENLSRSQEHVQNAEKMGSDIDANIGQFLNQGAQHDVRAAQGLSNRVKGIEDYWNNAYKTFQSNIADANFQMPKTAMEKLDYDSMSPSQLIQTFGADAFEALKKGKLDDFIKKQKSNDAKQAQGNNSYLQTLTEVAPTITDTNAADFLAKYKDFRDRTFKLSQRLRDPRVEEVEKQKMQEALTQARQMQGQMKEVLDAGLGEYKPEFERVNKGYSEQVYPLRGNKFVESDKGKMKIKKLPDNIIKALRTDEEGMPLLREIVKQDPELLRNVVGQRYFSGKSGHETVHNPNEMTREYLDEMPELKQLLSQREKTNSALQQAKSNAEMAKQHHGEVSARQVEATKTQRKVDDLQTDIDDNKKEISKMESHIDSLKKTAQRKNISLKEKMQAEKELKDLRRKLKDATIKLDEKVTGLRKVMRIIKTTYRIGKKII